MDEGLLEIYRKLRPGEPPTVESASSLIQNLFFDPKRYDLARVGRYKFNKKRRLSNRICGFVSAQTIADPETGELIVTEGDVITKEMALALEKAPQIAQKIACVTIMGGGVHAGNATKFAEFNIVADPEAASVVFSSGVKTVMIGLDATNCCLQPRSDIALLRAETTLGRIVPSMLTDYADVYKKVHDLDGMIIHDAISAVWLWKPELFRCIRCQMRICLDEGEHLGQTVPVDGNTCLAALSCEAQSVQEEILSVMQRVVASH